MAKYEHKGVGIELSGRGDFVATVGGKHRVFASVTSAKKAIDKAEGFVQFTALRDRNWQDPKGSDALVRVTIVGVSKKGGRGWATQPVWVGLCRHPRERGRACGSSGPENPPRRRNDPYAR
jgi:hypothetical protein